MIMYKSIIAFLSIILGQLISVDPNLLTITEGHITKVGPANFIIRESMRGQLGHESKNSAEIDFVYRGPSVKTEPFASGEVRRQIGIKLRTQDTCNVIYVMWYVFPTHGVHVSVKNNPGDSSQCGDNGYIGINPKLIKLAPPILVGENHTLRASVVGTDLQILADNVLVWQGELPKEAFSFDGPVGIRSDNINVDVKMKVSQ